MKRLTFVCCLKCSSELYILSGKLLLLPSFMVLCFIFCFGCGFSASVLLSIFIWFLNRIISNEPNNISSSVCCLFLVRDYKELVFFKWLHMVNLCQSFVLNMCSGHVEWFLKHILFKFNPLVQMKERVALHLYSYSKYLFIAFRNNRAFLQSLAI